VGIEVRYAINNTPSKVCGLFILCNAGGKPILLGRRIREAKLYFEVVS
jgi:hypothetical protein